MPIPTLIATQSRTTIDGKPTFSVVAADQDEEFHITPFGRASGDGEGDASRTAQDGGRVVTLPASYRQHASIPRRANGDDEGGGNAAVEPSPSDTRAASGGAACGTEEEDKVEGSDFFQDHVCPTAISAYIDPQIVCGDLMTICIL